MKTPDDILDDVSRQRWRRLMVIGVDLDDRLCVVSTENSDDTQDLAEIVALGFADRREYETRIRMCDS